MQYQNGIDFGQGPDMGGGMSGTWYNTKTGDKFTVRDWGLENNELVVFTTDGRQLNYNQIQNYVKSDKPIGKVENPSKVKNNEIMRGVQDDSLKTARQQAPAQAIEVGDLDALQKNLPTTNKAETPKQAPTKSINFEIIDRVLKDKLGAFEFKAEIECFPYRELETLYNVLNVPEAEVEEYIYNEMIEKGIFKQLLKDSLASIG